MRLPLAEYGTLFLLLICDISFHTQIYRAALISSRRTTDVRAAAYTIYGLTREYQYSTDSRYTNRTSDSKNAKVRLYANFTQQDI